MYPYNGIDRAMLRNVLRIHSTTRRLLQSLCSVRVTAHQCKSLLALWYEVSEQEKHNCGERNESMGAGREPSEQTLGW